MLNWSSLDPQRTERAIQTLLRQLYPGLRSYDGSGGDGGRDAELVTADGRTVFEVKSFGRLGSSQRRQIERSLRTAVESVPDLHRWVLVIPMNMTPNRAGRSGEQAWFEDKLPAHASGVELDWWGLDWLDGQAAQRPDFVRYLEGPDAQILERAALFQQEQAVLADGIKDLHQRVARLAGNVDDISMFWTLDFASSGGVTTSTLRAKVDDAHILDPITITPRFRFEDGDPQAEELREKFLRTMAFGGTVNLPAGYVTDLNIDASDEARLLFPDREPAGSAFTFTTARQRLDRHIRCSYQVLNAAGDVIAEFPVFLRERTTGSDGATVFGSDAADIITFEIDLPRPTDALGKEGATFTIEGGARLNLTTPETLVGYDVDSLLPVIGTLAAAQAGTTFRFDIPGLGYLSSNPLTEPPFSAARQSHELIADLHRLQKHAGSLFRFPANITNAQADDLHTYVRLLDGETVEHDGGAKLDLTREFVGRFLEDVNPDAYGITGGGLLSMTDALELKVGDLTIPYGPAAFYVARPRIANLEELRAIATAGDTSDAPVQVRFEPTSQSFKWVPQEHAIEYCDAALARDESAS